VSVGKLCIEVEIKSKIAFISEELCIGCGICVKVRRLAQPASARPRAEQTDVRTTLLTLAHTEMPV
jgi:ferredoxin